MTRAQWNRLRPGDIVLDTRFGNVPRMVVSVHVHTHNNGGGMIAPRHVVSFTKLRRSGYPCATTGLYPTDGIPRMEWTGKRGRIHAPDCEWEGHPAHRSCTMAGVMIVSLPRLKRVPLWRARAEARV